MKGSKTCRMHGSANKRSRQAAERNLAREKAMKVLANLGEPEPVDPAEALLQLVAWKRAEILVLRERVAEIEQDDLVFGTVKEKTGEGALGPTSETVEQAGQHTWYRLLHAAEDQLARYAKAALDAGIAERQVRIAEQQGSLIATALKGILDQLLARVLTVVPDAVQGEVSSVWVESVGEIVPRELRALGRAA